MQENKQMNDEWHGFSLKFFQPFAIGCVIKIASA
jgi:hypothetical protein